VTETRRPSAPGGCADGRRLHGRPGQGGPGRPARPDGEAVGGAGP